MADPIDEEHKDKPVKPQPEISATEKATNEIPPVITTETTEPTKKTEDMEVHHHAHHDTKRNWKSYLWEFLMLFLAVFCGFLAEYQLEHVIEHQREEVYINSMIADAETDIANLDNAIAENNKRVQHLDSLANLCLNYSTLNPQNFELYKHYIYGLYHPDFVTLTERTISQLKNAGGMRLIRNKIAADTIVLYDGMSKKLTDQQAYYELYQNNSINLAGKIFNFQKFGLGTVPPPAEDAANVQDHFRLISSDKALLAEFGNTVLMYEGVVQHYNDLLTESRGHAQSLIVTLKKEYDIE